MNKSSNWADEMAVSLERDGHDEDSLWQPPQRIPLPEERYDDEPEQAPDTDNE